MSKAKDIEKALEQLEGLATKVEVRRIERRVITVAGEHHEQASEQVMKLVRSGAWRTNLQETGFVTRRGKPIFTYVLERDLG